MLADEVASDMESADETYHAQDAVFEALLLYYESGVQCITLKLQR